jgi:hypothetical protein
MDAMGMRAWGWLVVGVVACGGDDGGKSQGDTDPTSADNGPGSGMDGTAEGTGASGDPSGDSDPTGDTIDDPPPPACDPGDDPGDVQAPQLWQNVPGETSWFASPVVVDLDGDGSRELVSAYYSVFVYGADLSLLAEDGTGDGRVYAPHVVADLDGDGTTEIVVGRGAEVYAYEWSGGTLGIKAGWPTDTTTAGNPPEVRGLAASDLDGDGTIEVVATTTQTEPSAAGGAQVFVYSPDGTLYQPPGIGWTAWPRYNAQTGEGNDADRNEQGHNGYGCYGLNVAIGNIDDDDEREILVTYDNHHIQAFDHDGVAIDAAPFFTNRATEFEGQPMTWGQFIRWADPVIEADHYNAHTGEWPHPSFAEWLQWTASPPNVVDLNGDGLNEVVGVPNVEMNEPYETQAWAVMVLEGAHGDGSRSAMRLAGWETLPQGDAPILVDGYYPPLGVPAPTTIDLDADGLPEVVVPLGDGQIHAFSGAGERRWTFDHRFGNTVMYASEVLVADLSQDGSPELVFSTFGAPDVSSSGHLVVLDAGGALLHDVPLPNPGNNGNGNGAPAAPTIGDLDGDGQLEIFVQTFDHGMDVFTVPGSAENCLLWPTARGGPLRTGSPS